jgi:O-antigen ligase
MNLYKTLNKTINSFIKLILVLTFSRTYLIGDFVIHHKWHYPLTKPIGKVEFFLLNGNRRILLLFLTGIFIPLILQNSVAAYICILISLGIILKDKKSGVLLLFIYFPIRPFLIEMNGGLKYLGDAVILFLFFMTIVKIFKERKLLTRVKAYSFTAAFILFCLTGTIAAFLTGVDAAATLFQNRAFVITFLLIFIMGELEISRQDVKLFLITSILMGTALSLHGLVEFISSRSVLIPQAWEQWNLSSVNEMRVYGLTANPNVLGTYLSICLFTALYAWQNWEKYKPWMITASILMAGTLCLTFSRGTILAFGIAFILYFLMTRKWRLARNVLITAAVGLIVIYYPANMARDTIAAQTEEHSSQADEDKDAADKKTKQEEERTGTSSTFSKRFKEMFSDEIIQKSSEWGRLYVVFKGLEIYTAHPVLGTGFGTFGDSATLSYGTPIKDEYKLPDHMYSDNQYIQLLVQTGTIGTIFVLTFVVFICRKLWLNRKNPFSPVLFSFLIAILGMALFYNVLEEKILTLYFYAFLGYFLSKGKHQIT